MLYVLRFQDLVDRLVPLLDRDVLLDKLGLAVERIVGNPEFHTFGAITVWAVRWRVVPG